MYLFCIHSLKMYTTPMIYACLDNLNFREYAFSLEYDLDIMFEDGFTYRFVDSVFLAWIRERVSVAVTNLELPDEKVHRLIEFYYRLREAVLDGGKGWHPVPEGCVSKYYEKPGKKNLKTRLAGE